VEGDEAGRAMAAALAEQLGGTALDVEGQGMALYHAGASIASNFLVALVDAATEALGAAGIARDQALPALMPLLHGTLENLATKGLPAALTGPVARGDAGTIERHLAALGERAPGLVALYRTLARRTVAIARAQGTAPAEALDAIDRSLAEG
jgi:predicted short-subunit dehydrogenase-like oxidoreductase (DUF2520 family)